MAIHQLAKRFTHVRNGVTVNLHVRTCVPVFLISGTAGRISLKIWCARITAEIRAVALKIRDPLAMRFEQANGENLTENLAVGSFCTKCQCQ